jgi:uncharacterized repeat protein (TIGR01451 family)
MSSFPRALLTSLIVCLSLAGTAGATTLDASLSTHDYAPIGHQTYASLVITADGYNVPVTFTYTTPPGLTYAAQQYLPYSCTAPADGGTGTITCTDYVTPGENGGYYTLFFNVPPSTAPGTAFTFNVTVTSPHTTPATVTRSASQTAALLPTLDYSTTLPSSVVAGQSFSYDLIIHNNGPGTAQDVRLGATSDTNNVPFVSIPPPCSLTSPSHLLCSVPDIPEGATTTLHVTSISSPNATVTFQTPIVIYTAVGESGNSVVVDADKAIDFTRVSDVKVSATAPAQVDVGSDFTYTATVTNDGPSTVADLTFTYPVPAGTTFKSIGPGFPDCTTPPVGRSGLITCSASRLTPASSFTTAGTWTIAVTLHAVTPGVVVGTGVVSLVGDPDLSNNTGTTTTTIAAHPAADIAVGIAVDATTTQSGYATTTLTVHNDGSEGATGVVAKVVTPPDTSASLLPASCTASGVTVTCTQATLAAGATTAFQFRLNFPYAGPQTITASVTSDTWDPNTANNNASTATMVAATVDLYASGDAFYGSNVKPGERFLFVVDVGNRGSAPAQTTTRITLPSGFTPESVQGCAPAVDSVLQCTVTLPAHTNDVFDVYLTAPQSPGNYTVVFGITSNDADLNPADNSAQRTVTVLNTQVGVSIDPDSITAAPAQVIAFTIRVTNAGQVTQNALHLTDTLPAGMTLLSATDAFGSCAVGSAVDCFLGTLVPGAGTTINVSAMAPLSGNVTNQVQVSTGSSVATATMSITVLAPHPQLDAAIDPVTLTAAPGQPITFSIRVTNSGNVAQSGIDIADSLPSGMSLVSAIPSTGTCASDANSLHCSAGTLQPGATISIAVNALAPLSGSTTNHVQASSSTDVASASLTINVVSARRQLGVTIDPTSISAVPAQVVSFTIRIANGGDTSQDGLEIADALPATMSLLSVTPSAGTCTTGGNAFHCSAATLASGGSMTIAVSAIAPLSGAATNSVQVNSATDTAAATMSIAILPTSRHHAARH